MTSYADPFEIERLNLPALATLDVLQVDHAAPGVRELPSRIRSMRRVIERRPSARLTLVGGGFIYRGYQREEDMLRRLAGELRLDGNIEFVGGRPPEEVADWMRRSAVQERNTR